MRLSGGSWNRLGVTLLAGFATLLATIATPSPTPAQQLAGGNRNANGFDLTKAGPSLPPTPPQGAWGEVIMANSKWIVVQNHGGQQFPIALNQVGQFLIRWPLPLNQITARSVVEAIGQDVGSNILQTDHIDVFEGADQSLVSPTYASLLPGNRLVTAVDPGFNRFMNGFDMGAQNLLYSWAYPVPPGGINGLPTQLHVVGRVVNNNPVQVSVNITNTATIEPSSPAGVTITQITRGDADFAEKGDVVYLMPSDMTPKSVNLTQLVLYKKIPRAQFQRAK
jgi:hypothetical protein